MTTELTPLSPVLIEAFVRMALEEDLGRGGDITTDAVVPKDATASVAMVAREEGCIAGLDLAETAFKMVDAALAVSREKQDGDRVAPGDTLMTISGSARAILTAERVALNFVGHMSGIASITRKMVDAVGNHAARITCTRKTTPGLRSLEKYAVRAGSGANHRFGLDDAVLIKDNHIAIAGGVTQAISRAKSASGHMVKIEVEVDTLDQLDEALQAGADVIMLDNMTNDQMADAVKRTAGRAVLEASGTVTLDRVPGIAATGVDVISAGWLTHSARTLDIGLDYRAAA